VLAVTASDSIPPDSMVHDTSLVSELLIKSDPAVRLIVPDSHLDPLRQTRIKTQPTKVLPD